MTQNEITELNLGSSLDAIANIDPRGYGVCRILYDAAREYTGAPLSMNAAKKLFSVLGKGDVVCFTTGFVLRPFGKAETDGVIGSLFLCRALVKSRGVRAVISCPKEAVAGVKAISEAIGLGSCGSLDELAAGTADIAVFTFTKDEKLASACADELIRKAKPKAVLSVECPGANACGEYHNATGLNVGELEAKQDLLFEKLRASGMLNVAVGDLGNEIGMGALFPKLSSRIPYTANGACRCGCKGGIAAKLSSDNIVTATVSDWGCYAVCAALAYLASDVEVMHTEQLQREAMLAAANNGLIDMYGEAIPAIDGFGFEITLPLLSLMRECVVSTLSLTEKCRGWFDEISRLGSFECESQVEANEEILHV